MPDPVQTPGQLLAGSSAPPSDQTQQGQQQQQQPAPAPPPQQPQITPQQQAVAARHHALGQATAFLFDKQVDPNTGAPIKQPPGAIFRSLLAGALLGGAVGSEGRAEGGSVGGFLGGAARGGNTVLQQQYQRQQQAQAQAQKQQEMSLEQNKFNEQKIQQQATLEHWNMENLAHAREADFHDREELEKEQGQEDNLQKFAIDSNARLANIPHNDEAGNGSTLMKAMVNNPEAFKAPDGYGRLLTKHIDFTGLQHDEKNGWTENGKPVDWNNHMQWSLYYVPQGGEKGVKVTMSGADWQKYYGVKGLDPARNYNVESVQHLVAAATSQRRNERDDFNQTFKEKHDSLNATISSARTNVTQLNSEKRELIRQGFAEGDDEVKEIDDKIGDEQKREQDAISDMHPRIRQRIAKQPGQPQAGGTAPNNAPSPSPTKGETQTHAGFTYTFNGKQWIKGQPAPAQ